MATTIDSDDSPGRSNTIRVNVDTPSSMSNHTSSASFLDDGPDTGYLTALSHVVAVSTFSRNSFVHALTHTRYIQIKLES